MYLFTNISITSNGNSINLCFLASFILNHCHKSVLKLGIALSLKIWYLIWNLLFEDLRFQRRLAFDIWDLTTWFKSLSQKIWVRHLVWDHRCIILSVGYMLKTEFLKVSKQVSLNICKRRRTCCTVTTVLDEWCTAEPTCQQQHRLLLKQVGLEMTLEGAQSRMF